jgi:CubicO group peptidase (beta-lactamase class C family)
MTKRLTAVLAAFALLMTACGGGAGGGASGGSGNNQPSVQYFPVGTSIPTSGTAVPGVEAFDQPVMAFMRQWNVPGAVVAVAKDGKLLMARGYGYSDFDTKAVTLPDSMFRIASVSKVLTALAVLRLRDRGALDLDQKFLSILTDLQVPAGGDQRINDITLRHMLQHSGGWNRNTAGDALAPLNDWAKKNGKNGMPLGTKEFTRYMMGQPLQFTPGTDYVYTGMGFHILGEVIERASGQDYEYFVREQVLAPMGVHAMSIAKDRASERGPFEVKYYPTPSGQTAETQFATEGVVSSPYAINMGLHAASGGWIASAIDLTRVMHGIETSMTTGLLSVDSFTQLRTNARVLSGGTVPVGLALFIGPTPDDYSHTGAFPGNGGLAFHNAAGYSVAMLTNTMAVDWDAYVGAMPALVIAALKAGFVGSATDLYPQYPSPVLPASH